MTGMVPASRWRELSNLEILQSVETALRILDERDMSREEVRHLAILVHYAILIVSRRL